jgi:hypothetical protein
MRNISQNCESCFSKKDATLGREPSTVLYFRAIFKITTGTILAYLIEAFKKDKTKPAVKQGRKATGLSGAQATVPWEKAGLP